MDSIVVALCKSCGPYELPEQKPGRKISAVEAMDILIEADDKVSMKKHMQKIFDEYLEEVRDGSYKIFDEDFNRFYYRLRLFREVNKQLKRFKRRINLDELSEITGIPKYAFKIVAYEASPLLIEHEKLALKILEKLKNLEV